MPLPELARHVQSLGFDGIELPIRPKFQVEPENIEKQLPEAVRILADHGLKILSVAASTDERTVAACGQCGIRIIRVCEYTPYTQNYVACEKQIIRKYEALVPALERHQVTIGLQNHCDDFVPHVAGCREIARHFSPQQVGIVWDVAHCALNGEDPEIAAEIAWPHLAMVNWKNAFWQRINGPDAEVSAWQYYWTTGRQGKAPWARCAAELIKRSYQGTICICAEYTDEASVNRLAAEDLAFAKALMKK
jgi:sugar phosphate isomerase/epimerase